MKNEQKSAVFNYKRATFQIVAGVLVAITMVYIFGKLAPVALVSYRMGSHLLKPLFN